MENLEKPTDVGDNECRRVCTLPEKSLPLPSRNVRPKDVGVNKYNLFTRSQREKSEKRRQNSVGEARRLPFIGGRSQYARSRRERDQRPKQQDQRSNSKGENNNNNGEDPRLQYIPGRGREGVK